MSNGNSLVILLDAWPGSSVAESEYLVVETQTQAWMFLRTRQRPQFQVYLLWLLETTMNYMQFPEGKSWSQTLLHLLYRLLYLVLSKLYFRVGVVYSYGGPEDSHTFYGPSLPERRLIPQKYYEFAGLMVALPRPERLTLLPEVCRRILVSSVTCRNIMKSYCTRVREFQVWWEKTGQVQAQRYYQSPGEQMIRRGGVWGGKDIAGLSQMLRDQGRPPEVPGL